MLMVCLTRMTLDVHENYKQCENGLPLLRIDKGTANISPDENDELVMDGTFSFVRDFYSPVMVSFSTERFERGEWRTGIMSRFIPDICKVWLSPLESWYVLTKALNKTNCPYPAGHNETFHRHPLGNVVVSIPSELAGDWKFFFKFTFTKHGIQENECVMYKVSILDVD
ncbi:uncharacterized protein LOC131689643 isoform X2 [Topomyia yanbarensis]|uniref:uncharacterized protein LOC131689643 isoform X2 n=1 Tax=Topomyia yanbarensis TaxID=2498891 RepID=UPI00273BA5FF|nr:uncharacterized protein LOC131689643 isoform X2 [Topomyia yanbarensis]